MIKELRIALLFFVGGVPTSFIVSWHCRRPRRCLGAKILFVDDILVRDDKGLHTRRPILRALRANIAETLLVP